MWQMTPTPDFELRVESHVHATGCLCNTAQRGTLQQDYFKSQGPARFYGRILVSWTLHFLGNQGIVSRVTDDGHTGMIFGGCSQQSYATCRRGKETQGFYVLVILIKPKRNTISIEIQFITASSKLSSAERTNVDLLHSIVHSNARVGDSLHEWIKVAHHHSEN